MPDAAKTDPLPPLEWLRVFEAAGRLGNFTAAARELGLTQAAVSQRMRNLEAQLGAHLFLRLARGVELTADGEAYLPHVRSALDAMRRGTADLFAAPRTRITIAAPASIASLWIAPRLAGLRRLQPGLQVSVAAVHRPTDFEAVQADLEVRFDTGSPQGGDAVQLYREQLMPCCAPDLLAAVQGADWRQLPIIAVSGPRDGWLDWSQNMAEPPLGQPALRFDSMIAAQGAAIAGAGVLLASLPLARNEIATGRLVELVEQPLVMDGGYWLMWRRRRPIGTVEDRIMAVLAE